MISRSVAGQQPTIHLGEDLPSVPRQPLQCRRIAYLAPVFGDADQMNDKPGNAVPFASIACIASVDRVDGTNDPYLPIPRQGCTLFDSPRSATSSEGG